MCELLRPGYTVITNHEILYECDGMNKVADTKWARYLLTFDHDHFDVVGFNPNVNPQHVATIITDNLRLSETKHGDQGLAAFEPFGLPAKEIQPKHPNAKKRIELRKL